MLFYLLQFVTLIKKKRKSIELDLSLEKN